MLAEIFLIFGMLVPLGFGQDPDAAQFCHDGSNRRNAKDHYANPADCHSFYQCFFHSETNVTAYLRYCPPGLYFNDKYVTCAREGPTPCSDVCDNPDVGTVGCAPLGNSCRSYIFCASVGSEYMCCPEMTHFNASTCECDADTETTTCTDTCEQQIPAVQTSTIAPAAVNETTCRDSYGNLLTNGDSTSVFQLIDPETGKARTLPCAAGSTFNLEQCLCGDFTEGDVNQPETLCNIYLPFNGDTADHSSTQASIFLYDDVTLSSEDAAGGNGSLLFNGGRVEIPATKNLDLNFQGSWCLFFRCSNDSCSTGGVLSNNNNENSTNYVFILAVEAANTVRAKLSLQYPISFQDIQGTAGAGWNQVCVVINGTYSGTPEIYLYINNQLASNTTASSSWTNVATSPYTLGNDQAFGDFYGYIDNVLICRHALSAEQVNAHYSGSADAMRQLSLIP